MQARDPAPNYSSDNTCQRKGGADTGSTLRELTHGEEVSSHFFELLRIGLDPALGAKAMNVLAKDIHVLMKDPCVDTDDGALWKVDSRYGISIGRDIAFKDKTNGRVNTKGFVDDGGAIGSICQQ